MLNRMLCAAALLCCAQAAMAEVAVSIGHLRVAQPLPPTLSNLDPVPGDLGLAGARTGLSDNATTGRFLGHSYTLSDRDVPEGDDPLSAARTMLAEHRFLLLDAAPEVQLAIADLPEAEGALLFNISEGAGHLRDAECRANLFHTLPSDAMRTDALAQVLVQKRWTDLALITGTHPDDIAYADAMRRSLTKFGLKLRKEKTWAFDADMRRNASQEVPLFTQDLGDYDALIVADELRDFGRYLLYNTWLPRPVVGSEGLMPSAWSPVIEQWGAIQLQNRFRDLAGRSMQDIDYAAWAAVRSIGEAVTRTGEADPDALRSYLLGDGFELAGFKGTPLTFRTWNGQLRQPIALSHPRGLTAQAPLDGFLHQSNPLDTLGLDASETTCTAFQ